MKKTIRCVVPALAFGVSSAMAGPLPDPLIDADFHPVTDEKVALGQLLAFDKILSGNQNISCLTCHHPLAGTGDGLSLPVGEGGEGLGVTRNNGTGADAVHERVPRNAPPLFALGHKSFDVFFHDGRVAIDPNQPSGFSSPAGAFLPTGIDNIVAAQAHFPVTSGAEMAGQPGENDQADATAGVSNGDFSPVWNLIADKVRAIPGYEPLFVAAYDDVDSAADINYVHIANAIAAFEIDAWRCNKSPFDKWQAGNKQALSPQEIRGMNLFYGKAGCDSCHSGPLQSDFDFHAIAMPQIGPGKGDNQDGYGDGHDDFGLGRETGNLEDRFKFRTPPLRQVAQTAPYGHAGAYATLDAVIRHHLDPVTSLHNYDPSQLSLPSRADLDALDLVVQNDATRRQAIADANELAPVDLSEGDIRALVAFMHALSDPNCVDLRRDVPGSVPSGLPVFD